MSNKSLPNGLIKGTIIARINWSEHLFSLQIKASISPFKAGQFIKLALQTETGDWHRRATHLSIHQ